MIDYNRALRKGYFQRLNGVVISESVPVRIYRIQAPNNAIYPYIVLSTQTGVESSTKNQQGQESTILIDIVTGFTGEVDDNIANDICRQIYQLIHPQNKGFVDVGTELQITSTVLLLDADLQDQNNNYKVYRRLIRFGHIINELTPN